MTVPPPRSAPTPPPGQTSGPPAWHRDAEIGLRVAGTVVAVGGGALLGVYATFMTPYRIGSVLVPVSIALAIGGNLALMWFAYYTTRNKFLALLPGLVWIALSFVGSDRTTEGDLILYQSNWVGTVYLFAGAITVGVGAYRLIVPKPPPVVPRA